MTEPPTPNIEVALVEAIAQGRKVLAPRETFYMSSLGFCVRKQIAERAGIAPTNPPAQHSQFKMWTGMVLGRELAKLLESTGYFDPAWTEKRITYRSYAGRPDGVTHRVNGSAVVEIKTTDDNAITRYTDLPDHYLWQLMCYCLASGIPTGIIFMIGKNQGLSKHRVFHLTEEWRKRLDTHIDWIESQWADYERTKMLPPCFHQFEWENKWCAYLPDPKVVEPDDV